MSRTQHNHKGPGHEYWGKRPSKGLTGPGRKTKRLTHRLERRAAGRDLRRDES
jgi:hypothetical protein